MSDENGHCTDDIDCIDGVQYTTEYGSKLRVVLEHNASTNTIRDVEELIGYYGGNLGATQNHLSCIEYPLRCVDTGSDRTDDPREDDE